MLNANRRGSVSALCAAGLFMGLSLSSAKASFHEWKIEEIFSNASGSVQFLEFQQSSAPTDDERFLTESGGITESASGHTFSFATNLPSEPAANQFFLVATPGYAALSGVPTADYILPSDNWFNAAGDTITYASGINSLAFTSGQLPTNGAQSLVRPYGSTTFSSVADSPTNFAGVSGSVLVPEPATLVLLGLGGCLGLLRERRARKA